MTSGIRSLEVLRQFAPGTVLRDAVELIIRSGTGALVVFGFDAQVAQVCSGGVFLESARFTAPLLAELAKMDGGIVVDGDGQYLIRANVHFIPDPTIRTDQTGTRFRTAERLAQQVGKPVLAVSEEGRNRAVVFVDGDKLELRSTATLYREANQGLNSIERLRRRLDEAEERLTRLEVDDTVTVRDVARLIQRAALLDRLSARLDRIIIELGGEGQLIAIQAADLVDGVIEMANMVFEDYMKRRSSNPDAIARLKDIDTEDLYVTSKVATAIGLDALDVQVRPRGIRALATVPRLPEPVREALLSHFRKYRRLVNADVATLAEVEGVGPARAQQVRSYLDRLLEAGTIGDISP